MKKILQFDDEDFMTEVYKKMFEIHDFEYSSYNHPPAGRKELIDLVLKEKPDLIIMDIVMPVMDGIQATKIIKDDSRTKDIPLCFLTNMGQEESINQGMNLGAIKYFITPQFTPSEIIREIKKILE